MEVPEKLKLISEILGRELTSEEKKLAEEWLTEQTTFFGGSNSPMYIARRLQVQAAIKKVSR